MATGQRQYSFSDLRFATIVTANGDGTYDISYGDNSPYQIRKGVTSLLPGAGFGGGLHTAYAPGEVVGVIHATYGIPYIIGGLPLASYKDGVDQNTGQRSVFHSTYRTGKPGDHILSSGSGGDAAVAVLANGSVVIDGPTGEDYFKLSPDTRSTTLVSRKHYHATDAFNLRAGSTKRDMYRITNKDEDLRLDLEKGDDADRIALTVGAKAKHLALRTTVEFAGKNSKDMNQAPINKSKNEGLAECRIVYREFAASYLDPLDDQIKAEDENRNFYRKVYLRSNTLELADNDLAEIVYGPLVDINGLVLDINHMPIHADDSASHAEINTVLLEGVSVSGTQEDKLSKAYPTLLNNATVLNIRINTLGTDYKREMHHSDGKDGARRFEGLAKGQISKNWAYDTALDSDIWSNINPDDLNELKSNKGAFLPPIFDFSVDKNGTFKLHVPASSLTHSIAEWTKYDLDETAEVSIQSSPEENHVRSKTKNLELFQRIKRYGGELYHPVHQTSLNTIGGELRVLTDNVGVKHYAMLSPVGANAETGTASSQEKTDLFDNASGDSHTKAYCPIGQSAKISLDGRMDLSIGRDHADWKSLVADLRGGAILRLGRMYDVQPCECQAEAPWGDTKVAARSGKSSQEKIFNDRRSLVFETDGSITGTIGRSIERELSLDLNMKAGLKLHIGKANYGISLRRKLIHYFRDYNPNTTFDIDSKINVGYRFFDSSQSTETWDEFDEERHDKIAYNPRLIDGTFKGAEPQPFPDGKGKQTPESTNKIADRSLEAADPKNHHEPNNVINKKLTDEVRKARIKHGLFEEVAHVVNNRHRSQGLGSYDSETRNNDERLTLKADARDTEAGSININTEADVLLTIRDDLDYTYRKGNRTSLRLDTSGQVIAWLGADIDDYRSLSLECDGAIQTTVGKTKYEGKSLYGLLKGGIKLIVGKDNEDVEHNTDEGLQGYPSSNSDYQYSSEANPDGTGPANGGKKYEKVGYHPHIDQATRQAAGAEEPRPHKDDYATWQAAIQQVNYEGTSLNLKTLGSNWLTLGMNKDKESLVLDTAGSVIAQIGVDKKNRSAIIHCDGSMSAYFGKDNRPGGDGGRSLNVQMAGGAHISIKPGNTKTNDFGDSNTGDGLILAVSGNVKIVVLESDSVQVDITTKKYHEQIHATDAIDFVYDAPEIRQTYNGNLTNIVNGVKIYSGKELGVTEEK